MTKEYVPAPGGADISIKLECHCHAGTALVIDGFKWGDSSDDEYFFDVGHDLIPTTLKERLRALRAIIRNRPYSLSGGVLTYEQILALRDWLNKEFQA